MYAVYSYDAFCLKFTGKERDAESGLDNFDFRYYASTMGRFMKPDDPFNWNESNPQTLNLYGYVGNNPLNRVDPDGHDCIYIDNDSGKMTGFGRGDCDNSTEALANSGVYVNGTVDVINENSQDQNLGPKPRDRRDVPWFFGNTIIEKTTAPPDYRESRTRWVFPPPAHNHNPM
jgi:RHS repeat-associated protein